MYGSKDLSQLQFFSRRASFVRDQIVADGLTLFQSLEACLFDGADMNEHVRSAGIGLNKAVTFSIVEPFYFTACHDILH